MSCTGKELFEQSPTDPGPGPLGLAKDLLLGDFHQILEAEIAALGLTTLHALAPELLELSKQGS